jgi:hypothetical protein
MMEDIQTTRERVKTGTRGVLMEEERKKEDWSSYYCRKTRKRNFRNLLQHLDEIIP